MRHLLIIVVVAGLGFVAGAVLRDVVEAAATAEATVPAPPAPIVAEVAPEALPEAIRVELGGLEARLAELLAGAAVEQRLALSLVERRLESIEANLAEVAGRAEPAPALSPAPLPEPLSAPLPEILEVEP